MGTMPHDLRPLATRHPRAGYRHSRGSDCPGRQQLEHAPLRAQARDSVLAAHCRRLRRDSLFAASNLLPSVGRKREALDSIAPYVRGESSSIPSTVAFLKRLGNAGSMGVANATWARRTTFNELNASGNLRLIENRVDARRSHYALTFHQLMPAEMRDSLDMASARASKLPRLLVWIRSEDFADLMNQELNYALFVRLVVDSFYSQANELLRDVNKEIRRCVAE